jgi:class 3 adenylate cyclase/tetratricopeptide (TPR) repeat protein
MPNAGTVTVVFTDLVGSTALASRIGDVEIEAIRRSHFAALRAAISATGGEEVKNLGDGLMVVYRGSADAIEGAVTMQRAVDRMNLAATTPLAMKIGVSVGDATEEAGDWFGTPINEAARLCAAAAGGQILISDVVRVLAGSRTRHPMRPIGVLELKGLPERAPVCEVEWEHATERVRLTVPATLPSTDRPCIGRDDELSRIRDERVRAADGHPVLVTVGGEPGVGKTRLAVSAAMEAYDAGMGLLYGRCDEGISAPFLPWVQVLRQLVFAIDGEVVRDWAGVRAGELTRIVPELTKRVPALEPPTVGDPESERFALFEAVVALLAGAAAAVPLFLILDDMHWADSASALLLRHILRNMSGSRLLVVSTYRDTDVIANSTIEQVFHDLRRDGLAERITVAGLDQTSTGALVSALAGRPASDDIIKTLHAETDGNPFFIEELLTHLVEAGGAHTEDRWQLPNAISEVGVPEGVADLVRRRAARLTEPTQNVLAVAAILGREFDLDVLAPAANVKDDEAADALDEALAIGLVEEESAGSRYRFAHSLIRSAIEESLGSARRARLHLRIGAVLEATRPADVTSLAHHYTAGTAAGAVKACEYSTRAARAALAALAYEEAAAHAERGLRAMEIAHSTDPVARADLLLVLAESRTDLSEVEAAHAAATAAAEEARRLDDASRFVNAVFLYGLTGGVAVDPTRTALVDEALVRLPSEDSAERALLLATRAEWAFLSEDEGDRAEAQTALEMANRVGDARAIAYCSAVLADLLIGSPHASERIALAARALEIGDAHGIGRPTFNSIQWMPGAFLELGDRAGCEAILADLEMRGRRLHLDTMVVLNGVRALLTMFDGRFDDADRIGEEAVKRGSSDDPVVVIGRVAQRVSLAREIGNFSDLLPQLEMFSTMPGFTGVRTEVGYWYLAQGRADDARVVLEDFKASNFGSVPRNWARPSSLHDLAEITTELEDVEAARQLLPLLDEYSGRLLLVYGIVASRGAADRVRGQLLSVLGRHDEAMHAFEAGALLEESVRGRSLLPRTRVAHARALNARGQRDDRTTAEYLLSRAAAEAQALGMNGLISQIDALRSTP